MPVFDCVTDRRIDAAYATPMLAYDGFIVHLAVSNALWPSYQPGTKAHFYARKNGTAGQEIDTRFRSGAQLNGNGDYLSLELQGGLDPGDLHAPMPQAQLETVAEILAEAHRRHGIPLRLMIDTRPNSPSSRGLGYHRLGIPHRGVYATRTLRSVRPGWLQRPTDLWFSKAQGKECPGDGRIAQIPQILALATEIAGTTGRPFPAPIAPPAPIPTTTPATPALLEEDSMPIFLRTVEEGATWLLTPGRDPQWLTPQMWELWKRAGAADSFDPINRLELVLMSAQIQPTGIDLDALTQRVAKAAAEAAIALKG